MIKSNFLLLSQWLNRDNITWLASVFNIFEKIEVNSYPFVMPHFYLTAMIERNDLSKDPEAELEVKLFNNEKEIKSEKTPIRFDVTLFKHKRMVVFNGVQLEESGKLTARLYCNGKEINWYSIDIQEIK